MSRHDARDNYKCAEGLQRALARRRVVETRRGCPEVGDGSAILRGHAYAIRQPQAALRVHARTASV